MNTNITLDLSSGWKFKNYNSNELFSAKVPGCIHLDLLNHKLIPDPFFGKNEEVLQWISDNNWTYKLDFYVDENFIKKKYKKIIFYGIDTFASVYLNNKKIIVANNMFHPWESDITNNLKLGDNKIKIIFKSPLKETLPRLKAMDYMLPADNDKAGGMSPYIRKAPYHFGWDWGPCLITSGLWKKVELVGFDSIFVDTINLNQIESNSKCSKLEIEIEIFAKESKTLKLSIAEQSLDVNKDFQLDVYKGENKILKILEISNPQLWWPSGHGDQHLYNFKLRLQSNNFDQTFKKRIGFRNIEIKREKDDKGESFEICVNGKKIFSKGANWIPSDSFTTRIKKEKYRLLLKSAVKANMNTIRVWGGGIYEPDYFYELCDELGILVWQDFMFACSLYPAEDKFLKNVEEEIIYQIKRLKSHTSIIMWCGNNEIAWAWYNWEWKENLPKKLWGDYKVLFHKVIALVCKKQDPYRLYWPTSPGHGTDAPNTGQIYGSGDNHYWGVWHGGESFEAYKENIGRFMSEYGMQSFPELQTIKTVTKPKDRDINSEVMKLHQKASLGNKNVIKYIKKYYLSPNSFESLLTMSQIMQAEAIKTAVESHRREMPYCMGTLYWQLNDCWPGASWSSIDYYGRWKALHYKAKNFFHSIIISTIQKDKNIEVYVINDLNEIINCNLVIKLYDFNGKQLQYFTKALKLNPVSAKKYFAIERKNLIGNFNKSEVLLRSFIKRNDKILFRNNFYFVKPKDINIVKPKYKLQYEIFKDSILITIIAQSFLYKVHIICMDCVGVFSENYFDLIFGEVKKIKFEIDSNLKINCKDLSFNVKTMYDLI